MENVEFKVGDFVKLKTSETKMLVKAVTNHSNDRITAKNIECVWQVEGVPYREIYPEDLLEKL